MPPYWIFTNWISIMQTWISYIQSCGIYNIDFFNFGTFIAIVPTELPCIFVLLEKQGDEDGLISSQDTLRMTV